MVIRLVFIFIFFFGGFFYLDSKNFFNAQELIVTIHNFEKHKHFYEPMIVELQGEIKNYQETPIWKIDLEFFANKIRTRPWVKDVLIHRIWPNQIKATVIAKEIKFLLISRKSSFRPVVDDGTILEPVSLKRAPNAPVLRGAEFEKNVNLRTQAVQVFNQIPQVGTFSQGTISEFYMTPKEGFWTRVIQDGIRVNLGREDIAIKSARVSQVIDYVRAHQIKAEMIDADLSKKVLLKVNE